MPSDYLPIFIFLLILLFTALFIIGLSTLLVKRKSTVQKHMPYECGVDPIGSARRRFSVRFFLIAVLFIIFDIEIVFLYPWAVIFRELRIFGLVEMAIFILILFIGLVYVWRRGALEWQ
jgi:NADH-quinone oxidoreductase subunit A